MPNIRKFPKSELLEALWDDREDYETVRDQITDNSRWSIHHEFIFKYDGKIYRTYYSVGATECQDESPWEYDGDEIDCTEVKPFEVLVTEYVNV